MGLTWWKFGASWDRYLEKKPESVFDLEETRRLADALNRYNSLRTGGAAHRRSNWMTAPLAVCRRKVPPSTQY
jgi:hypothetical protein